jgi:hypothetical protein
VLDDTPECRSKRLKGILSMASDLFKVPGQHAMEQYVARRIAAGVDLQVVRSRQQEGRCDRWLTRAEDLRELRWAPAGAVFTMTTWTYDDKVSFISSRRENFGIIIQSQEFSELMTTLFAVLWEVSTPAEARVTLCRRRLDRSSQSYLGGCLSASASVVAGCRAHRAFSTMICMARPPDVNTPYSLSPFRWRRVD